MANNDVDPSVMEQLLKLYKEGKIPDMNPNANMNQNVNMNPNANMNQFFINPNMMNNFPPFPFMNQGNMFFPNQGQPQPPSANEFWNLIFERKFDNKTFNVQINSDETVMTAFAKYRTKSLDGDIPLKFTLKGKPLDSHLTLSASGLKNNSVITVEKINAPVLKPSININPPKGFLNLVFDVKNENKVINITIESSKKVKDAIDAYFKKTKGKESETIFVYNSKTLRPEMTLAEAGLASGSKIIAISLVDLEGAF